MLIIYADLRDLKVLPEKDDYLFYNYVWKFVEETSGKRVHCSFDNQDCQEAYALYNELWKLRVPRLSRNWSIQEPGPSIEKLIELRQDDSFNLIEALDRIVNWSEVELLLRDEIMRRLQFAEDNGYKEGEN